MIRLNSPNRPNRALPQKSPRVWHSERSEESLRSVQEILCSSHVRLYTGDINHRYYPPLPRGCATAGVNVSPPKVGLSGGVVTYHKAAFNDQRLRHSKIGMMVES